MQFRATARGVEITENGKRSVYPTMDDLLAAQVAPGARDFCSRALLYAISLREQAATTLLNQDRADDLETCSRTRTGG